MLESRVQLGLTYYSLGRTPAAVAEWGAVLERDPGCDDARMYLRLVRDPKDTAKERVASANPNRWSTVVMEDPARAAPRGAEDERHLDASQLSHASGDSA